MKAVQYSRTGPPDEVVELVEVDAPVPGEGEVLIDVVAAPINPSHLLALAGQYAVQPPLPAVPGAEGIGRITGLGPGLDTGLESGLDTGAGGFEIGQLVTLPFANGAWCQQMVVRARRIAMTHPPDADPVQLSMLAVNPPTAYLLLRHSLDLQPGDWVIQNAANSAVGQYLIALARAWGIHTVNVVRRGGLADWLTELGADAVVEDGYDLPEQVAAVTGGAAIAAAIDAVGGKATARLAACVADGGRVVNYGLLSGEACRMPAEALIFRDVQLKGMWFTRWFTKQSTAAERRAVYDELKGYLLDGTLSARVAATYPLTQIREAVAHAMQGGRDGKIILTPNG